MENEPKVELPVFLTIAVALILLFSAIFMPNNSHDQLEKERENYCEMVEIYKSSDGEHGWPDYKKVYDKQCE